MAKMGRPTIYRDSLANAICIRLSLGESLNKICQLDKYPKKSTVYRWLLEKENFKDKYQRAREMQQENFLDDIIAIADDSSEDYTTVAGKNGDFEKFDSEHVQRSRLRIDTRKWVMERMAPRKYATKTQVDNISSDGSMSPAFDKDKYKSAASELSSKLK